MRLRYLIGLIFSFILVLFITFINSISYHPGAIMENSYVSINGSFSDMFLLLFGIGCIGVGYNIKGLSGEKDK